MTLSLLHAKFLQIVMLHLNDDALFLTSIENYELQGI